MGGAGVGGREKVCVCGEGIEGGRVGGAKITIISSRIWKKLGRQQELAALRM